jgi:hypothetical protein
MDSTIGLKLFVSGSGAYTTPATSSNASLIYNFENTGLISTGYAVKVGMGDPAASGKAATTTGNPSWSEFMITQVRTTAATPPGDTTTCTFAFQWTEN